MIGDGDRYCLNCGRPLTEEAARPTPVSTLPRPEPSPQPRASDPDPDPDVDGDGDGEDDLVACPRCGASNAARRRRCGRCGRPLEPRRSAARVAVVPVEPGVREGASAVEPEAVPVPSPLADVAPPIPPPRRRRGVAIVVVGLGAVLGTALGVAAATGVGPFATVEPVPFDPAAYPDPPRSLSPVTAGSSSTAAGDGSREFGPELSRDGDLTTAWVPDGEAEGALLRHGFVSPVWVRRLEVATGDQHDDATFAASGQVTRAMVDLGSQRVDVTIAPTAGVQVVELPEPVLTDEVTWEITGTSGDDAAISEVRYVGWSADEEDQVAYRRRQ